MLTSINFYISEEIDELKLRELVGSMCDVLTDNDLASTGNPEDGVKSVVVAKLYEIDTVEQPDFLEDIFEGALFAVLPIAAKGEENVS